MICSQIQMQPYFTIQVIVANLSLTSNISSTIQNLMSHNLYKKETNQFTLIIIQRIIRYYLLMAPILHILSLNTEQEIA